MAVQASPVRSLKSIDLTNFGTIRRITGVLLTLYILQNSPTVQDY